MTPISEANVPPALWRRLKFRARKERLSVSEEIARCLERGLASSEEPARFRDRARELRQGARGVLTAADLSVIIREGRA